MKQNRKSKEQNKLKEMLVRHITNNAKEYIIVFLIFIIGIFLGVLFVNNVNETQKAEIGTYINQFVEKMKTTENLQSFEILQTSLWNNVILAVTIWFFGTTVIGIPVVFGMVGYRGFCLGYSISVFVTSMGLGKGLLFVFLTLLLQNIIFIPALMALAVSGFKLYQSIVKDRRKENIKLEMIRHTIFSVFMLLLLCLSSVIEVLISNYLVKYFIQYF